jgi:hypothetical protein
VAPDAAMGMMAQMAALSGGMMPMGGGAMPGMGGMPGMGMPMGMGGMPGMPPMMGMPVASGNLDQSTKTLREVAQPFACARLFTALTPPPCPLSLRCTCACSSSWATPRRTRRKAL